MSLNIDTNTSKLNKQVLANAVSNAAYLNLGADVIDAQQGSAAMIGTGAKYTFTLFKPNATNYTNGLSDSALSNPDVKAINLEVGKTYSRIQASELDRANVNWEGIVSDLAVEVMNKRVDKVVKDDVLQMQTLVTDKVADILKVSSVLSSIKSGKQYGFADGIVIGDIAGSGTTLLPCTAPGAMNVDAVKVWNISNLRAMNLPKASSLATSVSVTIATSASDAEYSVVTASGLTAGEVYVFQAGTGKNKKYYTVLATSATSGKTQPIGKDAAVTATGLGADKSYACIIVRTEKAQAYKDFGSWIDADEKVTVEGVTLGLTKKRGNLSDKEYLYEMACCSGIADADKARVVWYDTDTAGFVVKG